MVKQFVYPKGHYDELGMVFEFQILVITEEYLFSYASITCEFNKFFCKSNGYIC